MKKREPIYKVIEDDLRKKINEGVYVSGETIPKEIDLSEMYQVSRPTVSKAIQSLVKDGILERKKRSGTVVCEPKIDQEFTQVIESYNTEMERKGLKPTTKVLLFSTTQANEEVALNLEIDVDTEVYKLIRLRYVDNDPIVLVTSYLLKEDFVGYTNLDFERMSLYSILTTLNKPVRKIKRTLEVILSDETTSDLLEINVGDPLFYFHSVGKTTNDVPVEYSISKYRGDKNNFVFELSNVTK